MKRVKNILMKSGGRWAVSLFLVLASCKTTEVKTILQERIVQEEPSFDGNTQDSGIKDYIDGKGFLVTKSAAARYNALIFIYGGSHVPPILENDGVVREGDLIYLTDEAMVNFILFNSKFKNGEK